MSLTGTSVGEGAEAEDASLEVANVKLPAFLPELKASRRSSLERNDERQTTNPKNTFLTGVALVGSGVNFQDSKLEFLSPRSRNVVAEMLMTMDLPRINFLRKEICEAEGGGLDRAGFVLTIGTCAIGNIQNPIDRIEDLDLRLVADLCELFAQIDINSDGTVDWDELSTFMIEMGMKGWEDGATLMPSYAYVGQIDAAQPTHAVDQIQYFTENDTVAVIEPNANFFRVYDASSMHIRRQYDIKDAGGSARALCFCNTRSQYALATSMSRVYLYEELNGSVCKEFKTPTTPICIAFPGSHDMIVAGDTIGNIFSWKVGDIDDTNTEGGELPPHSTFGWGHFKNKRIQEDARIDRQLSLEGEHTAAVMGILNLAESGLLASCGMDRTVKLWDLNTLLLKNTLLGHTKGVRHMAYCPDHRLIVSGGFSFDLVINNQYDSTPISRLHGHTASIVGVDHLKGTCQLITADVDGTCKLWDLRTFSCVETCAARMAGGTDCKSKKRTISTSFSAATREPVLACMAVSHPYRRVLVGGRTLDCFEVLRDDCEELTDDLIVLAAWFNCTNLTFVTVTGAPIDSMSRADDRAVKVWNGDTGELLCSDARISLSQKGPKRELTSFCPGTRGRKIVIGDAKGGIKVFNPMNHVELKSFEYAECDGKAHKGDVRALVFVEDHNLLISASGDQSIAIHDESQQDNGSILRRITDASWTEITAISYSAHLGFIASGNIDGSIQLWGFEFGRHEGCFAEKHQSTVTALAFLDPFPVLLSADTTGHLALWAVPPAREGLRFSRIFTWMNMQPVTSRMYGGEGGLDGRIPVAVATMELQVEMISTSSFVSTASTAFPVTDSQGDDESLQLSYEQENQYANHRDGADDKREAAEQHDDGEDEPQTPRHQSAREETAGDHGEDQSRSINSNTARDMPGNCVTVSHSRSYADTPAGSSGDQSSFQERLAATFRKYEETRRRHLNQDASRSGNATEKEVFGNTEMLAYTLYTGDDAGNVTSWDLKPLLLNLIHIHGGVELPGHGVGVVTSPVVYSSVFRKSRFDARDVLHQHRCRLEAQPAIEWILSLDTLGLHRIGSWEAHTEAIVCMHLVDSPLTVVTSGVDRLVKLWSPIGEPRGVLRTKQKPENPWTFRPDRKAQEDQKVRAAEDLILTTKPFYEHYDSKISPKQARDVFPEKATDKNYISNIASVDFSGEVGSGRYDQILWEDGETNRPRKFAEEELDRYEKANSRKTLATPSHAEESFSNRRRTPRRVLIRPENAGQGLSRRAGVTRGVKASLRTKRGRLIVSERLNMR